jgi:5-formyltetrahydrofolate cyclo-ligase
VDKRLAEQRTVVGGCRYPGGGWNNPRMSQVPGPSEKTAAPDKQTLRRQIRAQRRSLVPQRDRGTAAAAIAAAASAFLDTLSLPSPPPGAVGDHSTYGWRPCVAIYRSLPTEPPTQALAQMLHARGLAVIVPELLDDLDLDWHELRADGKEGRALGPKAIGTALVILTPALAVDHSGTRLGQGGGSYDRALARRRPDTIVVAIVNDEEYAAWPLPFAAHDVRVHAVITPGFGLMPIAGAGSAS